MGVDISRQVWHISLQIYCTETRKDMSVADTVRSAPPLAGIHHVKLAVSDLQASREWYSRVFGFTPELEFPDDDGVVRGLTGHVPGVENTGVALRENPDAVKWSSGFDPVCFGVPTNDDVERWADYLDLIGVPHSPVIKATIGSLLIVRDPDGTEVRLYSWERHDGEDAIKRGRPVTG